MVKEAVWKPLYDIYVGQIDNTVKLHFQAAVMQETGEDWIDTRIMLSSAILNDRKALPSLKRWNIGADGARSSQGDVSGIPKTPTRSSAPIILQENMSYSSSPEQTIKHRSGPEEFEYSILSDNLSNTFDLNQQSPFNDLNQNIYPSEYELDGFHTLRNGKSGHILSVLSLDLHASFEHYTVPKVSQTVYFRVICILNTRLK